ncbi:MAG: heptaprenyl diphosphate synthase component 2 [Clostridia bacterium]|nr:heptaprenyl diphosphate synthase component 2 [Clostridia bacterium]
MGLILLLTPAFFKSIIKDLQKVEQELQKYVQTQNKLLSETSRHLLLAGGKRLRPAFTLLVGKLYNSSLDKLIPLAAALEMIHMATLVHDDVVDKSLTRRGKPTVKAKWGDSVSLNTGDYLFAKSLIIISDYEDKRIANVLANVSVQMCQGEIQQLATAYNTEQGLRDYFYRIKRKTALLISASTQLGAIASGASQKDIRALKYYGYYLGMAFQITDDILDMTADEKKLGKPVGSDLRQGIITLPAIFTLKHTPYGNRLKKLLSEKNKSEQAIMEAISIIKDSGGIDYSFKIARKYIEKAKKELEKLPPVKHREVLREIASFIYKRSY